MTRRVPAWGDKFVDEASRVLRVIGENPLRYSIRFGEWRRANLRRFPHAIFYQVIGDETVVFAVLHGQQDHRPVLEGRQPTA